MAFPEGVQVGIRRFRRFSTAERLAYMAPGSSLAGLFPLGQFVWDYEKKRLYIGDATPESGPNTGTVGGLRVGPAIDLNPIAAFSSILTPAALTATTNNWAPTGIGTCNHIRASTNGSNKTLTGIDLTTGEIVDGRIVLFSNIDSSFDINLVNESSGSNAANRFAFSDTVVSNVTLAIKAQTHALFVYDNTSQRVRVFCTRPTRHFHSGASDGGKIARVIPFNVKTPVAADDQYIGYTEHAITIQSVMSYIVGGATSPNVTFNIRFATARNSGSPTSVFTSDIVQTSAAGTQNNSGFNDNTIPAGNHVWIEIVSVNGGTPPTHFGGSVDITQDFA